MCWDWGEATNNNILSIIFKGYFAYTDNVYVQYIKKKEEKYKEKQNIEPDSLKTIADNAFKNCVLKV